VGVRREESANGGAVLVDVELDGVVEEVLEATPKSESNQ
jgi:hypothetical protein